MVVQDCWALQPVLTRSFPWPGQGMTSGTEFGPQTVSMTFGCWPLRFYHESWPVWHPSTSRFIAICRWSATVFASRLSRVASGDTSLPFTCHACFLAAKYGGAGTMDQRLTHHHNVLRISLASVKGFPRRDCLPHICPHELMTDDMVIPYKLTFAWMDRTGWGHLFLFYCHELYDYFFVYIYIIPFIFHCNYCNYLLHSIVSSEYIVMFKYKSHKYTVNSTYIVWCMIYGI